VAALLGGLLLGVVGAVLAIPAAATIQVAIREYRAYRREMPAMSVEPSMAVEADVEPAH
jgi:predicted PurR-regulated permease PerM